MADKFTTGIASVESLGQQTEQAANTSKLVAALIDSDLAATTLNEQILAMAEQAAADALALATAGLSSALGAIGTPAKLPASLTLKLPLPFAAVVTAPEVALPTVTGSATVPEGDEETQKMFNDLQAVTNAQAAMGEAVFATLGPILQGIEDPITFGAADVAIAAAGIDDEKTKCPLPVQDTVCSIARMQLFDEVAYAFRRSGMSAGAEDPEAPGKILSAYITLAIEKFVRRAIVRVALPDDKIVALTTKLTEFGMGTAAKSDEGIPSFLGPLALVPDAFDGRGGSYTLSSADMFLGIDVVPMLTFYGGIDTLKDYGYNFDNSTGTYRPDEGETPLVNLQSILLSLKNGINFI